MLAHLFLSRHGSPLAAYNALQARLLRRFLASGGTLDDWCVRIAPVFRSRYGWMVTDSR